MPSRIALSFSVACALIIGATAVACTETVVTREVRPAATSDEAGATNPGNPDSGVEEQPDTGPGTFVFKEAPEGTFAQAVSAGGSVVKHPKLVVITFASDSDKTRLAEFGSKLATGTYWSAISAEYGVGPLTAMTPIVLSETAPSTIDDDQIGPWLQQKFQTDAARFGTPDSETLYAIFYPSGTTVTEGGGTSCESFGGYHFETTAGGKAISYAVVPRCSNFGGLSGADTTTFSASHEILEWATDPFPATRPAYMSVDDDHAVWGRVFLGELGDLCTQMDVAYTPPDLGFTVQRTWSNAAAKAGHHPCAPNKNIPYFTAFPAKLETISARDQFGRSIQTKGIKVPVGTKKSVDLTMYSDVAVSAWSVQVIDLSRVTGGEPEFSYTLDKGKGVAGDTLHLTITADTPAQQGQGFLIVSQHGQDTNLFPVWVSN